MGKTSRKSKKKMKGQPLQLTWYVLYSHMILWFDITWNLFLSMTKVERMSNDIDFDPVLLNYD